jgi:cell division protein FtsN
MNQKTQRRFNYWLALGLALLAVIILSRWLWQPSSINAPKTPALSGPGPGPGPAPSAQSSVKFDFYTVLPKMAVTSPSPPAADSTSVKSAKIAPVATSAPPRETAPLADKFVLQIASVHKLQDAERLREQMRNLGYSAFIQQYHTDKAIWYRVMVGPYHSPEQAQKAKDQLLNHRIDSIMIMGSSP